MADLPKGRKKLSQYELMYQEIYKMNWKNIREPRVPEVGLDEIFSKYIAGQQYFTVDVKKIVRSMLTHIEFIDEILQKISDVQKHNFNEVFIATSDSEELKKHIQDHKGKPFILCIYRLERTSKWVTFVITHRWQKKPKLYYVDSVGGDIPEDVKKALDNFVPSDRLYHSTYNYLEDGKLKLDKKGFIKVIDFSGPIAIRNLSILIKKVVCIELTYGSYYVGDNVLQQTRFWSQSQLTKEKLDLAQCCANTLGRDGGFINTLKEFLKNDLPKIKEEANKAKKYRTNMSNANNNGSIKSQDDVDNLRKEQFGSSDEQKEKADDLRNQNNKFRVDLETKYRKHCTYFVIIFRVLECCSFDDSCKDAINNISNIFGIEYEDLMAYYNYAEEESKKKEAIKAPAFTYQKPKDYGQEAGIKSIDEVIQEISFGVGQNSAKSKDQLKSAYKLFMKFHKKWSEKILMDVQDYAATKRGHLGDSDDDICEALAVLNRLLKLIKGYYMRETHVVTYLLALLNSKGCNKGKLFQIKTGEGKTNIVGILCAIKVLQGRTVDVITSNAVLAREGKEDNENFFSSIKITVSTNNPDREDSDKNAYLYDIVYGDISNFQFDYLRDKLEDKNKALRKHRKFDQVVIDEVDSMLIDNGGHIAKLAEPYPGMEALRYIYVKIWVELQKEIKKQEAEYKANLEVKLKEIAGEIKMGLSQQEANEEIERHVKAEMPTAKKLLDAVRKSNPLDCPLLPQHVRQYAEKKLDNWIKLAVHTHYSCFENEQYRVLKKNVPLNTLDNEVAAAEREEIEMKEESRIVPVDYENTGVTLMNTIWSNGHHQFVQLKHNFRLTYESLTSSYVSNIGYIKLYGSQNLIGVSGTLGSKPEQDLLSSVYNLEYIHVPTYKKKQFKEEDGIIVEDQYWAPTVVSETNEELEKNRAVLLICLTIKDHNTLKAMFEQCRTLNLHKNLEIRSVFDKESIKQATKTKLGPNTVVIATNIAGRGTNFKTLKSVEKAGGLHVIVTFVPCNERVEEQAFGRTSRQGHKGTAMLIIKRSEVVNLGLQSDATVADVKNMRAVNESKRLEKIRNSELLKIQRKDELFSLFAEFYIKEKDKLSTNFQRDLILRDITESWARWLDLKTSESTNDQGESDNAFYHIALSKTAKHLFDEFDTNYSLKSTEYKNIRCKNPFYDITRALILAEEDHEFARNLLLDCIKGHKENNRPLLYGAHMGLFEIVMRTSGQAEKIIIDKINNVLSLGLATTATGTEYLSTAKEHLNNAWNCLKCEIDYIKKEFCFTKDGNPDFQNIVITKKKNEDKDEKAEEDNEFLIHIQSRLAALELYKSNIDDILKDIKSVADDKSGQAMIHERQRNICTGIDKNKRKNMGTLELQELREIGLEAVYTMKISISAKNVKVAWAFGFIGSGFVLVGVCTFFPPIAPVVLPVAIGLICEGFSDLIFAILKDESKPDDAAFIKEKLISIATALFTMVFSAFNVTARLLQRAIKACEAIHKILEKGGKIAKFVMRIVDKVHGKLQAALNRLNAATRMNSLLSNKKLMTKALKDFAKDAIKDQFQDLAAGYISDKILEALKNMIASSNLTEIKKHKTLSKKLQRAKKDSVNELIEECFSNVSIDILEVFASLSRLVKNFLDNNILTGIINVGIDISKFYEEFSKGGANKIKDEVLSYLYEKLKVEGQRRSKHKAQNETAEKIADEVVKNIRDISNSIVDLKKLATRKTKKKGDGQNQKDENEGDNESKKNDEKNNNNKNEHENKDGSENKDHKNTQQHKDENANENESKQKKKENEEDQRTEKNEHENKDGSKNNDHKNKQQHKDENENENESKEKKKEKEDQRTEKNEHENKDGSKNNDHKNKQQHKDENANENESKEKKKEKEDQRTDNESDDRNKAKKENDEKSKNMDKDESTNKNDKKKNHESDETNVNKNEDETENNKNEQDGKKHDEVSGDGKEKESDTNDNDTNDQKRESEKVVVELEADLADHMSKYKKSEKEDITTNKLAIGGTATAIIAAVLSIKGDPVDIRKLWKKVYTRGVLAQTEGIDLSKHIEIKALPKKDETAENESDDNNGVPKQVDNQSSNTSQLQSSDDSKEEQKVGKLKKLKASVKKFLEDLETEESLDSSTADIKTRYSILRVEEMKEFFKKVGDKILNDDEDD